MYNALVLITFSQLCAITAIQNFFITQIETLQLFKQ